MAKSKSGISGTRELLKTLTYKKGEGGKRSDQKAVRREFMRWRAQQVPPIPYQCDNDKCTLHTSDPTWNGAPLRLDLSHTNGVKTDNRAANLKFLCPNCHSKETTTKGGANARRIEQSTGGFKITERDGSVAYVMPLDPILYGVAGSFVVTKGDGWRRFIPKLPHKQMRAIGVVKAEGREGALVRDLSERCYWIIEANGDRSKLDEAQVRAALGD
jgi:hypothetical protein